MTIGVKARVATGCRVACGVGLRAMSVRRTCGRGVDVGAPTWSAGSAVGEMAIAGAPVGLAGRGVAGSVGRIVEVGGAGVSLGVVVGVAVGVAPGD